MRGARVDRQPTRGIPDQAQLVVDIPEIHKIGAVHRPDRLVARPVMVGPRADEREHHMRVRDRDRAEAELLEELVGEGASGRFGQAVFVARLPQGLSILRFSHTRPGGLWAAYHSVEEGYVKERD